MTPTTSSLLTVPFEIRCMIFELVSSGVVIVDDYNNGRGILYVREAREVSSLPPAITTKYVSSRCFALSLVNKQLHEEVRACRYLLLRKMKLCLRQDYFTRCWKDTKEVAARSRDWHVVKLALKICPQVELVGYPQRHNCDFHISKVLNERSTKPELTLIENFWYPICLDSAWDQPSGIRDFLPLLERASDYQLRFRLSQRTCSTRQLHTSYGGCSMLKWVVWLHWHYKVAYIEFTHEVASYGRLRGDCMDGRCRGHHPYFVLTRHANTEGWNAPPEDSRR